MADCDNLLTNEDVLWLLMKENKTIVAPMLESRAAYSNYWCGMTSQVTVFTVFTTLPGRVSFQNGILITPSILLRRVFVCVHYLQGYYKRTAAYMPIRKQERLGCFAVPMVHSTFLVDLRKEASQELAFYPPHPEYNWALDDVIIFAYSASRTI